MWRRALTPTIMVMHPDLHTAGALEHFADLMRTAEERRETREDEREESPTPSTRDGRVQLSLRRLRFA